MPKILYHASWLACTLVERAIAVALQILSGLAAVSRTTLASKVSAIAFFLQLAHAITALAAGERNVLARQTAVVTAAAIERHTRSPVTDTIIAILITFLDAIAALRRWRASRKPIRHAGISNARVEFAGACAGAHDLAVKTARGVGTNFLRAFTLFAIRILHHAIAAMWAVR